LFIPGDVIANLNSKVKPYHSTIVLEKWKYIVYSNNYLFSKYSYTIFALISIIHYSAYSTLLTQCKNIL